MPSDVDAKGMVQWPAGVIVREAATAADAEFIVAALLQAGRDVSEDDSPFGLRALMEQPNFQQRQMDSSIRKVNTTVGQGLTFSPAERTSCLWIAVDGTSGQRLGSVGIFEATEEKRVTVAAYGRVERCTRLGELTSFYVAKDQRGRGLGLCLLRHALDWADEHGYDTLVLSVWRQLATARRLYRAHGFVTREQVYSPADPEADDVMVATLPRHSNSTSNCASL
jgi:GNAT superfamily N-acetyltransferase